MAFLETLNMAHRTLPCWILRPPSRLNPKLISSFPEETASSTNPAVAIESNVYLSVSPLQALTSYVVLGLTGSHPPAVQFICARVARMPFS